MGVRSTDHQKVGGKQYFDSDVQVDATLQGFRREVVTVTANTDLTAEDSGKIVFVNPAGTTLIQLPSAVANPGWHCKIIVTEGVGGTLDQKVNIGAFAGEFFHGLFIANDGDAGDLGDGAADDFINVSTNSTSGESIEIISDGAAMYVTGIVVDATDTKFHTAAG